MFDFLIDSRQETSCAHLYPAFCCISNNESHLRSQLFRLS